MNNLPDPMLQKAEAISMQQSQRQQQIKNVHRMTSVQIYGHLAAVIHQSALAKGHHEADPFGTVEGPLEVNVHIETGELMQAARYSEFAATVYMVGIGELPVDVLRKPQQEPTP